MEHNDKTFHYSYSAKQENELQAIREKYTPAQNAKMERLRKLDAQVEAAGTIVGVAQGILGAALFAFGMVGSLRCTGVLFYASIVVGVSGMILMGCAPQLHHMVVRHRREKIAPEVLRLIDEIEKEESGQ